MSGLLWKLLGMNWAGQAQAICADRLLDPNINIYPPSTDVLLRKREMTIDHPSEIFTFWPSNDIFGIFNEPYSILILDCGTVSLD